MGPYNILPQTLVLWDAQDAGDGGAINTRANKGLDYLGAMAQVLWPLVRFPQKKEIMSHCCYELLDKSAGFLLETGFNTK